MPAPLYIGVDAGGTKTAALAFVDGLPKRFTGPGAQVARDGVDGAADTLARLIAEARAGFGDAPLAGLAVGLAGAGSATAQAAVAQALRLRLGDVPLAVTHDADVALEAAFGVESGVVLLVGTGSVAYARTHDSDTLRVGGWGLLLGDDGSGSALGRAALRAVLSALDGGPPTLLSTTAADAGLGSAEAIFSAIYAERRALASFAPWLLRAAEAGDWAAEAAIVRETNTLAQQVGWLATRAGDTVEHRLATCGGLTGEAVFADALAVALERHLPGWSIRPAAAEPVEGALALARRLGAR